MEFSATKIFGTDLFASSSLNQRWSSQENSTLFLHNNTFIGHRRNISTSSSTTSHNNSNLWNTSSTHICLIIKKSSKMISIGKDFCLIWQISSSRIDQINAW